MTDYTQGYANGYEDARRDVRRNVVSWGVNLVLLALVVWVAAL